MMMMRCGIMQENALRRVLDDIGIEYTEEIGEAAFYGPKLDVNVKPAIGNEYTLSTCQLDFCLRLSLIFHILTRTARKRHLLYFTELFLVLLTDLWHIYLRRQRVTFRYGLLLFRQSYACNYR